MRAWQIDDWMKHHGIKGQKWGVRRTPEQLGHKPPIKEVLAKSLARDTMVEDAIRSGEVSKTINREKQMRHTLSGHPPGRSYLYGDLDYAQSLVDEFGGTGEPITLTKQIPFELGGIAHHCKEVYLKDPDYYNDYIPIAMLGATNDFYNFVIDSYHVFKREDGISLTAAWEMYKTYCNDANVPYPLSRMIFQEELRNYFRKYEKRFSMKDGTRVRSYYHGFRTEKFEDQPPEEEGKVKLTINFVEGQSSIFDSYCADCPAQYASSEGVPRRKWERVASKLSSLDTSKLHFVKLPENHIVIDFDIPDEEDNKSFERNLAEACKWPATYAEVRNCVKITHTFHL